MQIENLVVHRRSVIGSVPLEKVRKRFTENGIRRGLILGYRVKLTEDGHFKAINIAVNERYRKEFFAKAVKEPVIVIDTATADSVSGDTITASISVGPSLIRVRFKKPATVDDLEDADNYLRSRLVVIIGKLVRRTVSRSGKTVAVYYEPSPDARVKLISIRAENIPEIPTLFLLFIASGMLNKTGDGRRIRVRKQLIEKLSEAGFQDPSSIADLVVGLEVARRLHVFSTELLVQASAPGVGKSSFYARLQRYLSVSVYGFPPTKSFILRDHRYRPPKPGDIYTRDVVVFDEIGERSREAVRYAKEIRPEVKRAIDEDVGIRARLVLLSNRFNEKKGASNPKPARTSASAIREALAKVGYKAGIDQLEGRTERAIVTITATEDLGLHEYRKRSDRILDPHVFKAVYERDRAPLRTRRSAFILLRKRLRELGLSEYDLPDGVLRKAYFPLKESSGITVAEHQKAITEVGRRVRKKLEEFLSKLTEADLEEAEESMEVEAEPEEPATEPETEETETKEPTPETDTEEPSTETESGAEAQKYPENGPEVEKPSTETESGSEIEKPEAEYRIETDYNIVYIIFDRPLKFRNFFRDRSPKSVWVSVRSRGTL